MNTVEEENPYKFLAFVGGAILIASVIPIAILRGWAIFKIWGWYAVPVFSAPRGSVIAFAGLAMIYTVIRNVSDKEQPERTAVDFFIYALGVIFNNAASILICLLFAWLLKLFM